VWFERGREIRLCARPFGSGGEAMLGSVAGSTSGRVLRRAIVGYGARLGPAAEEFPAGGVWYDVGGRFALGWGWGGVWW